MKYEEVCIDDITSVEMRKGVIVGSVALNRIGMTGTYETVGLHGCVMFYPDDNSGRFYTQLSWVKPYE